MGFVLYSIDINRVGNIEHVMLKSESMLENKGRVVLHSCINYNLHIIYLYTTGNSILKAHILGVLSKNTDSCTI